MRFAKLSSLIVSVALASMLIGCASSSESGQGEERYKDSEAIDATEISIEDSGFDISSDGEVTYAFTTVNPNNGYIANNVVFNITAYDSNNEIIMGDAKSIDKMYAGLEYGLGGTSYIIDSTSIARMVISPSMELISWESTEVDPNEISSMYSLVNERSVRLEDGSIQASGQVATDDIDALAKLEGVSTTDASVDVCVILLNSNGQFVAGGNITDVTFNSSDEAVHVEEAANSDDSDSGKIENLKLGDFKINVPLSPGYKECKFFVTPSAK